LFDFTLEGFIVNWICI